MIAVEAAAHRQGARHAPSSQHPPLGGIGERLRLFVEGRAVQPSAGSKQGEGAGASSTALPTTYRKRQCCAPLGACTSHGWVRTQQAPWRAVPLQQLPAGSLWLCQNQLLPGPTSVVPHVQHNLTEINPVLRHVHEATQLAGLGDNSLGGSRREAAPSAGSPNEN